MAAGSVNVYNFATKYLMNGTLDLDTATIKLSLHTSSMTVDLVNHDTWSDVSSTELANGNGYTTGGATLSAISFTAITNGYKFMSSDVTWDATGGSIPAWRYGVFYASGTYNGVVNPIIAYFLGDSTPADVPATTVGNSLQVRCPTDGWFDMVRA
jgi:hypothetical protein